MNNQEFIAKAIRIHRKKYDYSQSEFNNISTKVKIVCPIHGLFYQTPSNHLMGKGCAKCGFISSANSSRKTQDEFIRQASLKHNNFYDYSRVKYINNGTKVEIICPVHGVFKQTPSSHIAGRGCRDCGYENLSKVNRTPFSTFIAKAKKIHNDKYSYKQAENEWVDLKHKVTINCPTHENFKQLSVVHLNGSGCPRCSKVARITRELFIKRAKYIHGDSYDYSLVPIINSHQKVKIICKKHGVFIKDTIKHLRQIAGCPKCKRSKGEVLISKFLDDSKIKYEEQKVFASCRDKKELPFDFYLPDYQILIEFQGQQHFAPYDRFGGLKAFNALKERDSIKKIWAKNTGVKLITISDRKEINSIIINAISKTNKNDANLISNRINKLESQKIKELTGVFIKKATKTHNNKYDYSKSVWIVGSPDIIITCPIHGDLKINRSNHHKGSGCIYCAGMIIDTKDFIKRSKNKFGKKFDYSQTQYINSKEKLTITCPIHGDFHQTPDSHYKSFYGCPKCAPNSEVTTQEFVNRAISKHGDLFQYSKTEYKGAEEKLTITCKNHGDFQTRPNDHLATPTGGCSKCANKSREKGNEIEIQGKIFKSLTAITKYYNIPKSTLTARLSKGWSLEKSLKTKKYETRSKPTIVQGKKYGSLGEAADTYGLSAETVKARINRGWSIDKAYTTPVDNK